MSMTILGDLTVGHSAGEGFNAGLDCFGRGALLCGRGSHSFLAADSYHAGLEFLRLLGGGKWVPVGGGLLFEG